MTRRRKILISLLVVIAVGTVAGPATFSAFSSTTSNGGNVFSAGTVQIADNDAGVALLGLSNAKPGDSDTGCIRVTYTGSLSASVRIYANVSGTLAQYLNLTVTRGTDSAPSFDSCSNFTADGTNYIGAGNGVVYSGTLASFPATWAAGLVDPISASPESWTNPESHAYKFTISLANNSAAQGQNASASFTWEAQNE